MVHWYGLEDDEVVGLRGVLLVVCMTRDLDGVNEEGEGKRMKRMIKDASRMKNMDMRRTP